MNVLLSCVRTIRQRRVVKTQPAHNLKFLYYTINHSHFGLCPGLFLFYIYNQYNEWVTFCSIWKSTALAELMGDSMYY
jgi:hypothetical protein